MGTNSSIFSISQQAALCRLLQLVSPVLPVGAYAYSHAFEYAVSQNWVTDEDSAGLWIRGYLNDGLARVDLPVLARTFRSWRDDDVAQVLRWNEIITALRETHELQLEDQQQAHALSRLLVQIGINEPSLLDKSIEWSYVTLFALAAIRWQINLHAALLGYAWSWCENQVNCAMKIIPLGQTSGQRILSSLANYIPTVIERALTLDDDDLGASTPALVIGSALHETQYSRLFRS